MADIRDLGRAALAVAGLAALAVHAPPARAGTTERVSVGPGGVQGNADSGAPYLDGSKTVAISADGRFVAFQSDATNLVAGDTNDRTDVLVRDRQAGTTELAAAAPGGGAGDVGGFGPAISADGRFVAFSSASSNLVEGETNDAQSVFVRDRETGRNQRVSEIDLSSEAALSADGRLVAFGSGDDRVYAVDRRTGRTRRAGPSPVFQLASALSLSADGRFVAFDARASRLVPGETNHRLNVFVRDLRTRAIERVGVSSGGAEGDRISSLPALSGDGRFVAFWSLADNLVPGDTNGKGDVFVRVR